MGRAWSQAEAEEPFLSYQNAKPTPIKEDHCQNENAANYEQAYLDIPSLKEIRYRSQFHIESLPVPAKYPNAFDSFKLTPRILVYDRQSLTKRSPSYLGIKDKSSIALASAKLSQFQLFDVPSRITKPNRSYKYLLFLESKRNRFDNDSKCFILHNHTETTFAGSLRQESRHNFTKSDFQIVLNISLPGIKYGNIGFIFSCERFDQFLDKLEQLLTAGRHEANYKIFCYVKIASFRIIDLTSKGKLGKAAILLESLQEIEQFLEPSEWTAWFYIARFYFMLIFLRKTSSFEFHKDDLYRDLNRARHAFNAEGADLFALERSLLLWWMFLIQADLIDLAVDSSNKASHKHIKHSASDTIDIKMAQTLLRHFEREKSVVGVYPTQNDEQQTLVDEYAKLQNPTDVATSSAKSTYTHDKQTFSSAGSVTTDEEDTPIEFVEQLYKELVKNVYSKCNGRLPSCVQEIAVLYSKKKIAVYCTEPNSQQLKLFLQKIGTSTEECIIQKVSPYELFTDSEYDQRMIQPGCSLFVMHRPAWENWIKQMKFANSAIEDKSYGPISEEDAKALGAFGSIGLLWIDKKTHELYLGTSCHGLGEGKSPRQGQDLVILSLRKTNDNNHMWMLQEIGSHFTGYYGTMPVGENHMLVDSLLIRVSKELLSKTFIDFSFRDQDRKESTIQMTVYKDDINQIKHLPIYSIDMDNGYGEVQGQIINTELGILPLVPKIGREQVNQISDFLQKIRICDAENVGENQVGKKISDRSIKPEVKSGSGAATNIDEELSNDETNLAVKIDHAHDVDDRDAAHKHKYQGREPARGADDADSQANYASDNNATDNSATDDGATDNNATDDNTTDDNATDNNATDNNTTDENATDDNATGDTTTDENATDNSATDDGEKNRESQAAGEGAFAIALEVGHEEKNFARKSHSGNLVYFKDPENPEKYHALGQIWMGPGRPYEDRKGKVYNNVTYCIPLKSTCVYYAPKMALECFVPPRKVNKDSGYDTRNSASN